jgi:RNA polymerase sigma factor (sigma-70 family)
MTNSGMKGMGMGVNHFDNDKAVVSRLNKGDHHSFKEIYNRFYTPLLNYGYQFNVIKDHLHDCIQDLFIDLWKNRHKLEINFSLQAYLFKSLRYKIQHQIKRDQTTSKRIFEYYKNSFEVSLDEEEYMRNYEHEKHSIEKLKESISQLAPKQKELIYLIFFNKLSYDDASKIMDISKKTAYNQIHSAIKNLRVSMVNPNLKVHLIFLLP